MRIPVIPGGSVNESPYRISFLRKGRREREPADDFRRISANSDAMLVRYQALGLIVIGTHGRSGRHGCSREVLPKVPCDIHCLVISDQTAERSAIFARRKRLT